MTRFQKYRRLVLCLFLISLAGLGVCGYLFLRDQVPDHILVEEGDTSPSVFHYPYSSFIEEETVEAGSRGNSDIPEGQLHMERPEGSFSSENDGEKKENSDGKLAIQCSVFGVIPLKTVQVETVQRQKLYAGGTPVGIYIRTSGILVIGTGEVEGMDRQTYEPAEHIVKSGDYILEADGHPLENKEELVECIQNLEGRDLCLEVLRDGVPTELTVTPVQTADKSYKAGIWVRNDAQGVGTLTYVDESGNFGALGHGISDVDTSTLLSLKEGKLYEAEVVSVKKGQKGEPGELSGIIYYGDSSLLGSITENTVSGIFGTFTDNPPEIELRQYAVAYKQEVKTGPAQILCSVDGTVREYDVRIDSVEMNKKEMNKGMVIQVTDEELLEKTGGIVQGMSGSPIIQDGKLVGAVTHVLVNDPTRGYGIFIENMLDAVG